MNKTSLKDKLIAYLENPKTLKDIYPAFRNVKPSTIRGRLNENVGKCFKRISRGVYLATKGDSQCVIIEGDAWDKIKDFEDDSIDVIITDPPYSCLDQQMLVGSTRKRNLNRGWKFDTKDFDSELLNNFYRVLKPKGHFYTFLPAIAHDTAEYNEQIRKLAIDCGFYFHKVVIWDKGHMGMGYHFRNRHETIYFFSKGYISAKDLPMTYADNGSRKCLTKPDVLKHTRPHHTKKIHETEKPVQLLVDILEYCTEPGDIALDPFGGSLSLALACMETKTNAIVIEKDKEMVQKGMKRVAAHAPSYENKTNLMVRLYTDQNAIQWKTKGVRPILWIRGLVTSF